jgi:hypothetical protein
MGLSVFYARVCCIRNFDWNTSTTYFFKVGASSPATAAQRSIRAAIKKQSGQHVVSFNIVISRKLSKLVDRLKCSDVSDCPIVESPYTQRSALERELLTIGKFQPASKAHIWKPSGCVGRRR